MSVVAVVHIDTADGMSVEALKTVRTFQKNCLETKECDSFEILQSENNENRLILIEKWHSQEDHNASLAKLMQSKKYDEGAKLFIYGPDVEYFKLK